ncbi:MAG: hypothetical protein ACRCT6_03965, partial [Notoacmeibacter sp.]
FFAASPVGQAGGVDRNLAAAGTDFVTAARTLVRLTIGANATGWTNGTVVVMLHYMVDEPA